MTFSIAIIRDVLCGRQSDFSDRVAFLYRGKLLRRHPELVLAPAAVGVVFLPVYGAGGVLPFLSVQALLIGVRIFLTALYLRQRIRITDLIWGWIAVGLNGAAGAAWAWFAAGVLSPDTPWMDAGLLVLIHFAALSCLGHATWLPALLATTVGLLGPPAVIFFSMSAPGPLLFAVLALIGIVLISRNALVVGRQILSLERLARHNQSLSNRLMREVDDARAGNRAKTAFLATMGHELKTPLNAIIGFAEIIALEQHSKLPDLYREYLQDIIVSGRHMIDVVNDVLSMARLESGRHKLDIRPADLVEVAGSVIRVMRLDADAAGVTLVADLPDSAIMPADAKAIRQILFNLVSNAIKFSHPGGQVRLAVSLDADNAVLTVADQGIGIADKDRERVLRAFEQAEEPMSRRHGGMGLGLPISLALVELHGGHLSLNPGPSGGTIVTVTLPVSAAGAGSEAS